MHPSSVENTRLCYQRFVAGTKAPALWSAMGLPETGLYPGWEQHWSVTATVMEHLRSATDRS